MNTSTNTKVVGVAAGAATVLMWLLGFFQPELMATAPVGLEAAFTGLIATAVAYIAQPDALNK